MLKRSHAFKVAAFGSFYRKNLTLSTQHTKNFYRGRICRRQPISQKLTQVIVSGEQFIDFRSTLLQTP